MESHTEDLNGVLLPKPRMMETLSTENPMVGDRVSRARRTITKKKSPKSFILGGKSWKSRNSKCLFMSFKCYWSVILNSWIVLIKYNSSYKNSNHTVRYILLKMSLVSTLHHQDRSVPSSCQITSFVSSLKYFHFLPSIVMKFVVYFITWK